MKNLIKIITVIGILLLSNNIFAQNTNPVVSNVAFSISGTTVTVTYDISDAEQTTVNIQMFVSSDNGVTWNFNYGDATGDGDITGITSTPTQKTITWTYSGGNNENFKIKIIANDLTADGGPCPGTPTVTFEGKTYNTVQIADQCWLKENLNYDFDPDTPWSSVCYDNDPENCDTYGRLYKWYNAQYICPTGWHIPTLGELTKLRDYVGSDAEALKAIGQGNGTNTSGFSALLAGVRASATANYLNLGSHTYFWSSTESTTTNYPYSMRLNSDDVYLETHYGNNYLSVRCIKNH